MKNIYSILFLWILCNSIIAAESVVSMKDSLLNEAKHELYSNPQQTMHLLTKLFNILPEKKSDIKSEAFYICARAERSMGDFDGSLKSLYSALSSFSEETSVGLKVKVYDLMSLNYCTLGDYNRAFELNDEATALSKAEKDSLLIAGCYNCRGIIYTFQGQYEQADKFLKQALSINRSRKELKLVAANLNNLCLYEGNIDEKISWINEAIVINRNLGATWSLSENYNNMGRQYYYAGQYVNALDALDKAYVLASKINAQGLICDNYEYKAMVYASMGDYRKAYETQGAMYSLRNKLQSENKLRTVEREIVNEKLREQRQKNELRHQEYEIVLLNRNIIILVILIVFIIVISVFMYQRFRRIKKLELMKAKYRLEQSEHEVAKLKVRQQELELHNVQDALDNSMKEVTNFAVFLQSRNELLDKVRSEIKAGYKMDNQDLIPHLKKINAFINQYQVSDKTTSAILNNIDEKSREFVCKLTNLHPDLTQGEKHLATLLRVNLSTKEIAMLTGNTPKTVNMNRYRLRKALDLQPDEDLIEYLQSV